MSDAPRDPPDHPEVKHYKSLMRLAEERAREIRRVAALDRERLEERLREHETVFKFHVTELDSLRRQLKDAVDRLQHDQRHSADFEEELAATRIRSEMLGEFQGRIIRSRAHRLAEAYVRHAGGNSPFARAIRRLRPFARSLNRIRRALMSG
jgi:DNA repair exonuclease SbcCD ATPase subunit